MLRLARTFFGEIIGMMLSTKQKIALARLAQKAVLAFRACRGQGNISQVKRKDIVWELDLNEGIDFSIWLFGRFQGQSLKACQRHVSEKVVSLDIGANIGAFTLPLAQQSQKVIAFEPTNFGLEKLKTNINLNPSLAKKIDIHQIMLRASDDLPKEDFLGASWPLDAVGVDPVTRDKKMATDGAQAMTLDRFLLEQHIEKVDFIKLDVDGFESEVLEGARQCLARLKPVILIELTLQSDGQDPQLERILTILEHYNYYLIDERDDRELPMDLELLSQKIPYLGGINALACPKS